MKLAALKVPTSNPKDASFASEQQKKSTHLRHILKKIVYIIDIAGYISSEYQNPQIYNASMLKRIIENNFLLCLSRFWSKSAGQASEELQCEAKFTDFFIKICA